MRKRKMSIEQIINMAKKIRGENSFENLKGEKEILEKLYDIEENTTDGNKEFNEKLLELKEKNNADSLVFSLVTNDSYEDVRDTKYLLKEFFDPSIKFGRNFFEDGYIVT